MQSSSALLNKHIFKRAQRGLYAGEMIRFGDQVSEMGNRTRRTWKPNVQRVTLWSETLQERLSIRVTTKALGLIDKAGGLDSYILEQRVPESFLAEKLKKRILLKRIENELESSRNKQPDPLIFKESFFNPA